MSTDLLLDVEPVTYRELVTNLPRDIQIKWSFDPAIPGLDDTNPNRKRCYADHVVHVLLKDKCGNSVWLREANEHSVQYKCAEFVGEAAFEHFGLQGSLVHFGHAFRAAEWGNLYDTVTGENFDSQYLRRKGDDVPSNLCRHCSPS